MKKEEIVMGLYAMRLQGKNRVAQERNNTVDRAVELINQLDEPEQTDTNVGLSKPVIPQFVADWIEKQMKFGYEDVFISMTRLRERAPEKVKFWFRNNSDTYARAWLDGYEVEKEKKYHIKFSHNQYACRFNEEAINSTLVTKYEASEFTEAEIKAIDGRLMVFAQEVTE